MAFTATTGNSAAAWRPDLFTFAPVDAIPDSAVINHSTVSAVLEGDQPVLRVAYVDDDTAQFVAEGAEIDESEPTLAEAVVHSAKFAQLIRISREQYRQDGTADHLADSVRRAITAKADAALLGQPAPVSPATAPVTGLALLTGTPTGTVTADLDPLVDLEAAVRANGANPTAWLLAPDVWAALRKIKTASGAATNLLGAGTDQSEARLLSIPVAVNSAVPTGTGLLVDRQAIISAVSPMEIATSVDRYFTSDSIAVRATMRTGHVLPRPGRLGIFYVDAITHSWTVTLGSPSAGNYTLTWRGRTTGTIAHNATAATVKTALVALDDGYTADNWTVTGSAGGPYTVTTPGGGALTGNGSGLTDATFTITG